MAPVVDPLCPALGPDPDPPPLADPALLDPEPPLLPEAMEPLPPEGMAPLPPEAVPPLDAEPSKVADLPPQPKGCIAISQAHPKSATSPFINPSRSMALGRLQNITSLDPGPGAFEGG